MSRRPRLASTRLVKVRGSRRWTAAPAYIERNPGFDEITGLLHQALHEVVRAAHPALDLGSRRRAAVAASVSLAGLVLRASGYDTVPPLAPQETLEALSTLFGPEGREWASVFLTAYAKSDLKGRRVSPAVLQQDFWDLARAVDRFRDAVMEWLEATHPEFLPKKERPSEDLKEGDEPYQKRLF